MKERQYKIGYKNNLGVAGESQRRKIVVFFVKLRYTLVIF